MAYFKMNGKDYSKYVNQLKVTKQVVYTSENAAAGHTRVFYIGTKRTLTVGIIPLDSETMASLQSDINNFTVTVSYRDPDTNELIEGVNCYIPVSEVEYYTIQADKVLYKAMILTIPEL